MPTRAIVIGAAVALVVALGALGVFSRAPAASVALLVLALAGLAVALSGPDDDGGQGPP